MFGTLTAACSASGNEAELFVFAASSLTSVGVDLEREFEVLHPGINAQLSTAGSQTLRLQIEQGARADVFMSANAAHIDALRSAKLIDQVRVFAQGELVLVTPASNPAQLAALRELPRAERIVLGSAAVPVGGYAEALLEAANAHYGADFAARVMAHVVSREPNVRLVLAKVELGEADAAVVYRSDLYGRTGVRAISIPSELRVQVHYHAGVLSSAPHPKLARAWLEHLALDSSQASLQRHGFASPPESGP